MPLLEAKHNYLSGVPLGGIGAGKIEVLPTGLFNSFTFLNNWTQPVNGQGKFPGILGYHLGVFVQEEGCAPQAFLLQTVPVAGLPTVASIRYEGHFPLATLRYHEPSLGLELTLEAFSPWAPSDIRHSSLPCTFFELRVRNKRPKPVRVGLLFIGRNLCGDWCVGRMNRIVDEKDRLHLDFSNVVAPEDDVRRGEIRFSFEKKGWKLSYIESWNAVTKNFHFNPDTVRLSAWEAFSRSGELPNESLSHVAQGENQELCGAVAATTRLKPGEERRWDLMASWHFPQHRFGHRYQRWFDDASAVERYVRPKKALFRKKIARFHSLIAQLPFPEWFRDALANNLSPFFSSSWYVKDGRFAFYEAPVICPLMGTIDVGFYGSIPLSYFFPKLEISQMDQFAGCQRHDGYIPHDLGRDRIDTPSNGTTFYFWKDLNPKFALMAWRDFLWSKDEAFLERIYPHVKKAMLWAFRSDRDGDGLPDHEGADQTFDLWDFEGPNPYTSGIFLAALLAARQMALRRKDTAFAAQCQRAFKKGRVNFESKFWNGKYFGKDCQLSQLNGQWYADLLGLGDIASPAKIKTALGHILKYNSRHSRYGLVNSVKADMRLDTSNNHAQNIWFGMNYAFLSLCILRGMPVNKLLKPAKSLWDNVTTRQRNPWNQPDMIDWKTGRYVFGDAYYRNMAIWSIPIAYARRDKKTARLLKALRSI